MCGIVGYVGNSNKSLNFVIEGLRNLQYRGYDSSGIAVCCDNKTTIIKKSGKLSNLIDKIKEKKNLKGSCAIGHTRWATHGKPCDINSHPIEKNNIILVHNGIIENYEEIKKNLIKIGYTFETETDTEIIAALVDHFYKGDPIFAIKKSIEKLKGSYALGIIFKNINDKLFAIRKDSPLIIGIGSGENFLASDIPAIIKQTKKYIVLDENEIAILKRDGVDFIDPNGNIKNKKVLTIDWNAESAEKNGYSHFMLKEIFEQPRAIKRCLGSRIDKNKISFQIENLSDEKLSSIEKIFIVACGTAMHAGMVGKYIIEKIVRIPVEIEIASEFRYKDPVLSKNSLVIIISQSGETADSLAALELAKKNNILTLGIVNVVNSSIARISDSVLYTWAGPEISVASTKAFSVQMASLYLLALKLAEIFDRISKKEIGNYCSYLNEMSKYVDKTLNIDKKILQIANKFYKKKDIFFIGRGLDYYISLEASLKLKELSYIHSEAYAAGELKHGPISLIEKDTPVVAIATQQNLLQKTLNNVKEVAARGATVILICCENENIEDDVADYIIKIPKISDIFTPFISIIPLQLFAYHTAVLRGCDVDKPRNLAKSVTVE